MLQHTIWLHLCPPVFIYEAAENNGVQRVRSNAYFFGGYQDAQLLFVSLPLNE